jgi:sporulation protein YlmC with PRC-barrel domain
MLHRISRIVGSRVVALDGEVGKVHDAYIDDAHWVVRYLVVATGGWLSGRKVLVSPQAVELIDHALHAVSVSLTRDRVRESPNIDTDKPVSRQHESEFNSYYGYSTYWAGTMQWGNGPLPPVSFPAASDLIELEERRRTEATTQTDSHLRSTNEIIGYSISAIDDRVGHVEDFLVDDETWAIRYLTVDTGVWLFGRRVLVGRDCVEEVDWASECVKVGRTREQIKQGLEFDMNNPPPGDYEAALAGEFPGHRSED